MTSKNTTSLIIIGAGPIGLETALYARQCGFRVTVLEKGEVGDHLRRWQHITLFSPFGMNATPLGRHTVQQQGATLPEDDAYLTAGEYLERYLLPLASTEALQPCIHTGWEVLAIGRKGLLKGEHIGNGRRRSHPFKILARNAAGEERIFTADGVIDASGTFGNPNYLGEGGIPAIGELPHASRIRYDLPDIAGADRLTYRGKTTLVVGSGHSAGNTLVGFRPLFADDPDTRVIWVIREDRKHPLVEIPDDPLAERARIVREANALADHPQVHLIRSGHVTALHYHEGTDRFSVDIDTPEGQQSVQVDRIIANVGYGPDNRLYRELQVHECYASRGPMKLAAALLGESSADCLTQTGKGPEVLRNPEPDFYILGMKSYGKHSSFLLKIGFEQIRDVFRLITGDPELDLYRQISSRGTRVS